jgi:hypothetical protein
MKLLSLVLFSLAYVCSLNAQPEKLGIIEVYGARTVSVADIRRAIGMKEGDTLDRKTLDKSAIEKRILSVPGIMQANVSLVCCDDKEGRSILYAGVSEKSAVTFPYHKKSAGAYKLDSTIIQTYRRYENIWMDAVKAGKDEEDNEQGHVLLTYPPAAPLQDSFVNYAASDLPLLRKVIRESGIAEQRQIAAWIIAYTADKKMVLDDLLYAAADPDETVRNNATRALGVMARYAYEQSSSATIVPSLPFLKMIHSIIWTDRNKAAMLLEALTSDRDSTILQQIKTDALPEVEEMARWENPGHTSFSVFLLGRIANISDQEIFFTISDANRQVIIDGWMRKILRR